MRVPQLALARIRATGAQQHAAGYRRHARSHRVDDLAVRFGTAFICRKKRQFVQQGGCDAVASHASERCRVNLDGDPVAQADALLRLALDLRRQHRRLAQQAVAISQDRASLLSIGGYNHDGCSFPRTEERSPVAKTCEEAGDKCEHEALSRSASTYEPPFGRWLRRQLGATSVLPVDRGLLLRHRQCEHRSEKRAPCCPRVALEERAEHFGIIQRLQDVHRAAPRASNAASSAMRARRSLSPDGSAQLCTINRRNSFVIRPRRVVGTRRRHRG